MSQAELSRRCGVKPASVNGWLNGKAKFLKGENLLRAAAALGVNPEWLASGRSPMYADAGGSLTNEGAASTVPIISWIELERGGLMFDPALKEREQVSTTVNGGNTFAVRVCGDSMAPLFPGGVILIVDRDMKAEPGDYVIARWNGHEATFKQLVRDAGELFLKPANPQYPTRPLGEAEIVGVVRETVTRLK